MENKRGFGSRLGFILSMAAFCIGIGNLWKFPYMVGNNGGGAFLVVYLLAVILVGIPGFLIELTLGRKSQLSPVKGMAQLEGKKRTPWSIIGVTGMAAIFIMVSYATTIVGGWTLAYIVKIATGQLSGLTPDQIAATFGETAGAPYTIAFSAIEAILLWLCLNGGVKKGVEKICSILLPTLFVIMIGLAIYANLLPGAGKGLAWYLTPNLQNITASGVAAAAVQVLYSVGIGMCCAFVYGSYFDPKGNLPKSSLITAGMDSGIAILAGLICVPALFSFGIEPTAGPSLIFITLPNLFNAMGGFGIVFGLLFMLCVFFAGFTSNVGGSEALVASFSDSTKLSRRKVATIVVIAQFLFSIPFTLSFQGTGFFGEFKCLGLGFFDFFCLISDICLCLGAIAMLAYVIFRWGFKKFQEAANEGATGKIRVRGWMKSYLFFIYPIVLLVVLFFLIKGYFPS